MADAALLLSAIAGFDPRDPYAIAGPVPDFVGATRSDVSGVRVAWSGTLGYAEADPEVVAITRACALALADQGAVVREVEDIFDADPVAIWSSEFYTGVGARLRSSLEADRGRLDPVVARCLEIALRQGLCEHQRQVFARFALRDRILREFAQFDVLLSPTLPVSNLDAARDAPEGLEHKGPIGWSCYTYPFNLTGQPALSICAGSAVDGSPVGIQVVGPVMGEGVALRVAAAIERTRT